MGKLSLTSWLRPSTSFSSKDFLSVTLYFHQSKNNILTWWLRSSIIFFSFRCVFLVISYFHENKKLPANLLYPQQSIFESWNQNLLYPQQTIFESWASIQIIRKIWLIHDWSAKFNRPLCITKCWLFGSIRWNAALYCSNYPLPKCDPN